MALDHWLRQCLTTVGPGKYCERCARLLAPVVGSHFEKRAADLSAAVEAHGHLTRRAWRAEYPQEGGEELYQCQDCGSWWGHTVWTCVPQQSLAKYKVRSVEEWVKKWSLGEVIG